MLTIAVRPMSGGGTMALYQAVAGRSGRTRPRSCAATAGTTRTAAIGTNTARARNAHRQPANSAIAAPSSGPTNAGASHAVEISASTRPRWRAGYAMATVA